MVNITSPTIDKMTGKSYDHLYRNDYKNCCSGGGGEMAISLGSVPNGQNDVVWFKTAP
jgi:hypothetical protein